MGLENGAQKFIDGMCMATLQTCLQDGNLCSCQGLVVYCLSLVYQIAFYVEKIKMIKEIDARSFSINHWLVSVEHLKP